MASRGLARAMSQTAFGNKKKDRFSASYQLLSWLHLPVWGFVMRFCDYGLVRSVETTIGCLSLDSQGVGYERGSIVGKI